MNFHAWISNHKEIKVIDREFYIYKNKVLNYRRLRKIYDKKK